MNTRAIALDIYAKSLDISKNPVAFEQELASLMPQDIAFIKRLVLTALRKQEFLRRIINQYASKKLPQKLEQAHLIIILGAVEILYFSTPDYAAINSYVDLAKAQDNPYIVGFVNAVLRKIATNKEDIAAMPQSIFFPKDFAKLVNQSYNKKQVAKIEAASLVEPPLDITAKSNHKDWAKKLGGKLMGNGTIRIFDAGAITKLNGYEQGQWWVQDLASSLAVQSLGNIRGKKVLDLCAAPGGKTAQLLNNGAEVTALDISASRLSRLEENMQRLKLQTKENINANAIDFLKNNQNHYDIILLDAPCSATGTLRRHPEIVHTKSISDIKKSAQIQKQLLHLASKNLNSGGVLLYATCSLAKEEGELQIKDFLQGHGDFSQIKITSKDINIYKQAELNDLITSEGYIRCIPSQLRQDGGLDGFFVAKLKREDKTC